jgi:supervillin
MHMTAAVFFVCRLAALKKNGEENWKKKVPKVVPEIVTTPPPSTPTPTTPTPTTTPTTTTTTTPTTTTNNFNNIINNDNNGNKDSENGNDEQDHRVVPLRKRSEQRGSNAVGSLQERLSQLQNAQSTWQGKVVEKDASKFTVAGKMGQDVDVTTPRPSRKDSVMNAKNNELTQFSAARIRATPEPRRFHGSPPPANDKSYDEAPEAEFEAVYSEEVVHVPEFNDEELDKFFSSNVKNSVNSGGGNSSNDISIDDFDAIANENDDNSSLLLNHKKNLNVKPLNRKRRSRNPVKALAARKDLKQTYNQQNRNTIEEEEVIMERTKKEKTVHSHLAAEAKAGLAATEDFSNIQLKKDNTIVPNAEFVPFKPKGETMLLQIKGRRICQTRLVEPKASSINSGDAFVALNGTDVVVWQGQFANVIERSRSAEVGQMIVQKKDLGCKKARRVTLVEEEKVSNATMGNKLFWSMLGCSSPQKATQAGPPEEDENFEVDINDLNLVWYVNPETNELVPVEDFWGHPMKHEVLEDDRQVLVFDFGNEVYIYNGKNAPFPTRRLGLKLAKDMFEQETRPSFTLFGRINQNMETVLFKEKFLNWPDKSRLIKPEKEKKVSKLTKTNSHEEKFSTDVENNFDSIEMARWPLQESNLELEGTFLGKYYNGKIRHIYLTSYKSPVGREIKGEK